MFRSAEARDDRSEVWEIARRSVRSGGDRSNSDPEIGSEVREIGSEIGGSIEDRPKHGIEDPKSGDRSPKIGAEVWEIARRSVDDRSQIGRSAGDRREISRSSAEDRSKIGSELRYRSLSDV